MRLSRSKRILFTGVTIFLVGLISLLILELGLRLFRDTDKFFPHFPNSVRHFYPSESITPGVSGVSSFSTNSFGGRGREPNSSDRLRILTIGGSTTADTILDDEEAWPALLERYLNDGRDKTDQVWVINSGVDGLNSHHHLMHAKYFLPQLPGINYVIIYAGANDMGMWFHNREFDPQYLAKQENWNSRIGEAFRWSTYTPRHWPIYKQLELWKTASRLKDIYLTHLFQESANNVIVQDAELKWLKEQRRRRKEIEAQLLALGKLETLDIALDSYESVIQQIVQEIRQNGAEPILVPQIVQSIFISEEERSRLWMGILNEGEGYVSEEQYPAILNQYNERMRAVAARKDVFLIDLPKMLDTGSALFYDGMHFNELGAQRSAAVIADYIKNKVLPTRKNQQ